ncbi:MAG: hypothetical protein AAFP82_02440 [Bacteroidota bacterium]
MYSKYTYLVCLFLFFGLSSIAQGNFNGLWKGTITQNDGGYKSNYDFELYLHQDGKTVYGRSYVFDGELYAEMELKGEVYNDNYLRFQETKIVDHTIGENMEWCIKRGQLLLSYKKNDAYISGLWKGKTSFSDCIPGRIELKKEILRASIDNY